MRMIKLGLALIFLCTSTVSISAQSVQKSGIPANQVLNSIVQDTPADSQDADELKTQRQLIAELKFLRKENAGLKDEVAAEKGKLAVQIRFTEIEKERGDWFKDSAS